MKSLRSVIQSGFARAPFLLTAGAILTAGTLAVGITAASASIGSDDGTTDQGRGDQSGIPITPSTVIVVFDEGSAGDDGTPDRGRGDISTTTELPQATAGQSQIPVLGTAPEAPPALPAGTTPNVTAPNHTAPSVTIRVVTGGGSTDDDGTPDQGRGDRPSTTLPGDQTTTTIDDRGGDHPRAEDRGDNDEDSSNRGRGRGRGEDRGRGGSSESADDSSGSSRDSSGSDGSHG